MGAKLYLDPVAEESDDGEGATCASFYQVLAVARDAGEEGGGSVRIKVRCRQCVGRPLCNRASSSLLCAALSL